MPLTFDPSDLANVDWGKLDAAMVADQFKMLDTLTSEQLKTLTGRKTDYVSDQERKDEILRYVEILGAIGLRFVGI